MQLTKSVAFAVAVTDLALTCMHSVSVFLPRDAQCTIVQSAVLRLRVVRPLVDQDHIGWKSWKLIALFWL